MTRLLEVQDLTVDFETDRGRLRAVDHVSLIIEPGQTLGIVGESGSGKSVSSLALVGLVPPPGKVVAGTAQFLGRDLLKMSRRELTAIRGDRIAMVFQDPLTSLNPFLSIADQLTEVTQLHRGWRRRQALEHAIDMLEQVGIPQASRRIFDYPHQFSGGMRQRVMIAMALSCKPDLLIADEPTTALDVTIQAQILDLLAALQQSYGTAVILITHDLGVVARACERVAVMNSGRIVETGPVERVFAAPEDPYTQRLLASRPDTRPVAAATSTVLTIHLPVAPAQLLQVRGLKVHYPFHRGMPWRREHGAVRAVDGISIQVEAGETFGLVGESGSGKSTTGRAILGLVRPTSGEIYCEGRRIDQLSDRERQSIRRQIQIIFQDPYASLNPRMTIGSIIAEPMHLFGLHTRSRRKLEVMRLLERVGLDPRDLNRYPHEFSGGQRQRVGIARALAAQPKLIVCDEPVSALDLSIQAQVINLLADLQQQFGLAYLFISHDLSVVRHLSRRVGVMYEGKLVEVAETEQLFAAPQHPYTRRLLSAVLTRKRGDSFDAVMV